MDILTEEKPLFEIDENRLNELIQLCKQYYPHVSDYFIHSICNEQCMIEQGYEPGETLANEYIKMLKKKVKSDYYQI